MGDTREAGEASGFQTTGWLVFFGQDLSFGVQKTRLYSWDNRLCTFMPPAVAAIITDIHQS